MNQVYNRNFVDCLQALDTENVIEDKDDFTVL